MKESNLVGCSNFRNIYFPELFRNQHPEVFWNCMWYFWYRGFPLEALVGTEDAETVCINRMHTIARDVGFSFFNQLSAIVSALREKNLVRVSNLLKKYRQESSIWRIPTMDILNDLDAESYFVNSSSY